MRGKVRSLSISYVENRITPAYAGKSFFDFGSDGFNWDHPRLCGEKRSGGSTLSFVRGSPPPMRGKVTLEVEEEYK